MGLNVHEAESLLMRTTRSALSLLARAPARCSRLLEGARPLIQPHDERPQGTIDMLSGKLVEATNDDLGWELPNVDLTENFTDEDLETLQQASDDAGGILVFTNQKESMTVHDHVRFARRLAEYNRTEIEPHAVAAGLPEAPEILEIVREATAEVVFGENWHSDNSFMARTCSYSILRGTEVPRLGVNDTLFSSAEDAYDALSPTMQNLLLDLNAYHSANKAYGAGHPGNSRAAMEGTLSMKLADEAPILENDVLQVISTRLRTRRIPLLGRGARPCDFVCAPRRPLALLGAALQDLQPSCSPPLPAANLF